MDALGLMDLVASLNKSRHPIFLVGGAVRDRILGITPHDLDFTAQGNVRRTASAVADALNAGFYALDDERGTYRVVLDGGRTVVDFASLRGMDLQADLLGRDFSINAMALDIALPQVLIDPLGGLADLRQKRLRACSANSLSADPVRALRAVRLSIGLGLEIDPQTLAWIQAAVPLLARISAERIRDELFRMLESPRCAACLRFLDRLGLADVVLPEFTALKGVTQSAPHIQPVWDHTLEGIERLGTLWDVLVEPAELSLSGDPILDAAIQRLGSFRERFVAHYAVPILPSRSLRALLTFAVLYHDSAKPAARSVEPGGRIRFFGHEIQGAQLALARARALAFSGEEAARVETIIAGHMRVHQMSQGDKLPSARAMYRFFRDTGPAGIDICLLSLADTWATYGHTLPLDRWLAELQTCQALLDACWERTDQIVNPPRLVDGNDVIQVLSLRPGPAVGRLLEAVREAQVEGEIGTRAEALEFIRRVAHDLV
jgi:tRNA nucleotidyltransferase/poly(A) polymerase